MKLISGEVFFVFKLNLKNIFYVVLYLIIIFSEDDGEFDKVGVYVFVL